MYFCDHYDNELDDQEDNDSVIHFLGIQKGVEEVAPDEEFVSGRKEVESCNSVVLDMLSHFFHQFPWYFSEEFW